MPERQEENMRTRRTSGLPRQSPTPSARFVTVPIGARRGRPCPGPRAGSDRRRLLPNGQQFSRQNIHAHYHRHMQVVERATVERARLHARNAMLDVESAKAVSRGNEELRDLLREGARRAAESEALRWTAKDVIAFLERDEQMEQERSGMQIDLLMRDVRAFSVAVRMVLPQPLWGDLMERATNANEPKPSSMRATSSTSTTWTIRLLQPEPRRFERTRSSRLVKALPQRLCDVRNASPLTDSNR
jgi:hypothetical protein